MPGKRHIKIEADDKKKGMTREEMIDALGKMKHGTSFFTVVTGFRGQVRAIEWDEGWV